MSSTGDPEVITEKGVIHTNVPGGESADDLYTGIPGSAVTQNPEACTTPPEGNLHRWSDRSRRLQRSVAFARVPPTALHMDDTGSKETPGASVRSP